MEFSEMDRALLETVSENSQELFLVFDERGVIRFLNKTAACELSGGRDLTGQNITNIFPLVIFMRSELVYWNMTDEYVHTFAYRKNQTCFPVKLRMRSLGEGEHRMGLCFAINDTERNDALRSHQKAMEKVADVIKMKNEFTANITHELRTPLNGIKGMAESLSDTELTQEQAELVTIILKCCDNMTKIINDILDFSKIEACKLIMERREFNFKNFLDEILMMNAATINRKGLKLIVDVGKNIPARIVGDELRLGQVLNNLFSNAVKFTSAGHIGLEVANIYEDENEVELIFMVVDTGIGIAPEDKDKLFKSFSQVDGSITRRFGGTGLGLVISKQLVELMGGRITVDSEKGTGSSFSFTARFGKASLSADAELNSYPEGRFVYDGGQGSSVQTAESIFEEEADVSGQPQPLIQLDGEGGRLEENEMFRTVTETLEKLIICVELGAWEKAEIFAGIIKGCLNGQEKQWKQLSFSLLLNVRKENHDKSAELADKLQNLLEERQAAVSDDQEQGYL